MAKKQFFLILDTETTIADTVADFGAIVVDREGVIVNQCSVMIKGEFDRVELFYDKAAKGVWSLDYAKQKRETYTKMLNDGSRVLATSGAVNRWIDKAVVMYNPVLTAYNLAFDRSKCHNTAIDLTNFTDSFCLWGAAVGNICKTKAYKQFALENHLFNKPTEFGNMTYQTNAEAVTGFLSGEMTKEPHTAIEDAIFYELPILKRILKIRKWKEKIEAYNWRDFQVKNNFKAM